MRWDFLRRSFQEAWIAAITSPAGAENTVVGAAVVKFASFCSSAESSPDGVRKPAAVKAYGESEYMVPSAGWTATKGTPGGSPSWPCLPVGLPTLWSKTDSSSTTVAETYGMDDFLSCSYWLFRKASPVAA